MLPLLIAGIVIAAVVAIGAAAAAASLASGKRDADENFSPTRSAGGASEPCPLKTKDKSLEVRWDKAHAYCGEHVKLLGTAKGLTSTTTGKAQVDVKGQGNVASLEAKGQSSFTLPWQVSSVTFAGRKAPKMKPATGRLSADGLSASTKQALEIKRVPDKKAEAVSFKRKAGIYGWTASFRLGIEGNALLVRQTLQIKKAWLGKKVSFDAKADKLKQAWGYVKKSGAAWKYYDTASSSWKTTPRNISKYTLEDVVFVENGSKFTSRDDGGKLTWPETFSEPKDYDSKKKAWLKNIHDVWDGKFKLHRKDCKSKATGCCEWAVDVKVNWSTSAGDKLVYAIWAADWERSNAQDWYLSENRLGVAGHECGHLLGAYDEYKGGAVDPVSKKIEADTIMGQDLTTGKARHLDGLRDEASKKINAWVGKTWDFEIK